MMNKKDPKLISYVKSLTIDNFKKDIPMVRKNVNTIDLYDSLLYNIKKYPSIPDEILFNLMKNFRLNNLDRRLQYENYINDFCMSDVAYVDIVKIIIDESMPMRNSYKGFNYLSKTLILNAINKIKKYKENNLPEIKHVKFINFMNRIGFYSLREVGDGTYISNSWISMSSVFVHVCGSCSVHKNKSNRSNDNDKPNMDGIYFIPNYTPMSGFLS